MIDRILAPLSMTQKERDAWIASIAPTGKKIVAILVTFIVAVAIVLNSLVYFTKPRSAPASNIVVVAPTVDAGVAAIQSAELEGDLSIIKASDQAVVGKIESEGQHQELLNAIEVTAQGLAVTRVHGKETALDANEIVHQQNLNNITADALRGAVPDISTAITMTAYASGIMAVLIILVGGCILISIMASAHRVAKVKTAIIIGDTGDGSIVQETAHAKTIKKAVLRPKTSSQTSSGTGSQPVSSEGGDGSAEVSAETAPPEQEAKALANLIQILDEGLGVDYGDLEPLPPAIEMQIVTMLRAGKKRTPTANALQMGKQKALKYVKLIQEHLADKKKQSPT